MPKATVTRPPVILKDDQSAVLSEHDLEFEAISSAEAEVQGTYTVERPPVTITVEA